MIKCLVLAFFLTFGTSLGANADMLKGTLASLTAENRAADEDKLTRISDSAMLERFKERGILVFISSTTALRVDTRLNSCYAWARPWARLFLQRLSDQFQRQFHQALQVNSAVRTAKYQAELRKRNGNAAKSTGSTASTHLTGATVDITKKGLSAVEIQWLRSILRELEERGVLFATEEFLQAVFHVFVRHAYADYVARRRQQ